MILLNRAYAHFILLICLLHQMHGSRLPLEIVDLETGARLTDQEIINSEYQIVHDSYDMLAGKDDIHDDKTIEMSIKDALHINRKTNETPTNEVAPRIFYQTGVSILYIFFLISIFFWCVCLQIFLCKTLY